MTIRERAQKFASTATDEELLTMLVNYARRESSVCNNWEEWSRCIEFEHEIMDVILEKMTRGGRTR